MNQKDYRACMIPHMKGSGPDRKLRFCLGAKLCSGKASTREEAERLCAEQAKIPKPFKITRGKCTIDLDKLASCVAATINLEGLTAENLASRLEPAIQACGVGKPAADTSYRRFMNACLKETGGGGDFLTSQRDIKKCQVKWNEREVAA